MENSSDMAETTRHLHLVSDATGETIHAVTRACLAQFEGLDIQEHLWSLVRTQRQMNVVLEGIRQWPGLVLSTFADETLRGALSRFCQQQGLPHVAVLAPVLSAMSGYFGKPLTHTPGKQHALDAAYFARIEAVNFAMATDDGHRSGNLEEADVVVLGVSRTSKTPTCIYLANRGFLAANVPVVPGTPLPEGLDTLTKPLVVGLTKDPDSLVDIRRSRVRFLDEQHAAAYTDSEKVREEVLAAKRLFARLGCPVIDVTRRSVEETATEIITLLNRRKKQAEDDSPDKKKEERP